MSATRRLAATDVRRSASGESVSGDGKSGIAAHHPQPTFGAYLKTFGTTMGALFRDALVKPRRLCPC